MSHYKVAVIHKKGQSIDELLAPYNENIQVEPYIQFSRQEAIDYAREHWVGFADKPDEDCWLAMTADAGEGMYDENLNILTTYNPKSKWDWWSPGGRFDGELRVRHGRGYMYKSEARIGSVDFSLDEEEYAEALEYWKENVEGEGTDRFYSKDYYLERFKDAETYATCVASFCTYAVITPDGEWHAPGEMGWFACSSETGDDWVRWVRDYQKNFIDTADPKDYIAIIDCHI